MGNLETVESSSVHSAHLVDSMPRSEFGSHGRLPKIIAMYGPHSPPSSHMKRLIPTSDSEPPLDTIGCWLIAASSHVIIMWILLMVHEAGQSSPAL